MTVEEFNLQVNKWSLQILSSARNTLRQTHGSGRLSRKLARYVNKDYQGGPANRIRFQFDRYGVFRAYGAGRGYVVQNGQILRGQRVRSLREIRNRVWNREASRMLEKGFTTREINMAKWYDDGKGGFVRRSPLDWIDVHIQGGLERLADVCQTYYGDEALKQVLLDLDRLKIVKK